MNDRYILNNVECQVVVCGSCGVTHAIPAAKYDTALAEGGFWTCPNGHSRGWDKSASERAAEKRATDRIKQENARLQEELSAAVQSHVRADKALTRHKKRAAAGVCPCCTRTFANMGRHMKTKHPGYNVVPLKAAKA